VVGNEPRSGPLRSGLGRLIVFRFWGLGHVLGIVLDSAPVLIRPYGLVVHTSQARADGPPHAGTHAGFSERSDLRCAKDPVRGTPQEVKGIDLRPYL